MASNPPDFPFGIMDVAQLLGLRIRRRQAGSVYADCPFCGDKRGKMNLNLGKNVWRCNYCGAHGGMLALYAQARHTTNSDAYREICESLLAGDTGWGSEANGKTAGAAASLQESSPSGQPPDAPPQSPLASPQQIHQTLSLLFGMLTLTPKHRAHLRSEKRGLTDEQIDRLGFRSTPPYYLCRPLTERLIAQGCTVQGVPGFYQDKQGRWTVTFSSRAAGILIPAVGLDGLLCGAQILLDIPIKNKDDPPDKPGAKYIWLSSAAKPMGASSGSPVHFVGDPFARVVYVTEGLLKADIAHCLMYRSFAAVAGANNVQRLDAVFRLLAQNGTELIVEAHDMDKYSNRMIAKGSSEIYRLAKKNGMECQRLTWNPNYKGIDDWQLALRKRGRQAEGAVRPQAADAAQSGSCPQRFRLYQLNFDAGQRPIPFAFRGLNALYKAGYEQPPAAEYRRVLDTALPRGAGQTDEAFLQAVRAHCRDGLPQGCQGRPMAPSDIVELYGEESRRYFYVEPDGFTEVRFSPFLTKSNK